MRAFDALAAAEWFNRNAITENELLIILIKAYNAGTCESEALLETCRAEAMHRFGK